MKFSRNWRSFPRKGGRLLSPTPRTRRYRRKLSSSPCRKLSTRRAKLRGPTENPPRRCPSSPAVGPNDARVIIKNYLNEQNSRQYQGRIREPGMPEEPRGQRGDDGHSFARRIRTDSARGAGGDPRGKYVQLHRIGAKGISGHDSGDGRAQKIRRGEETDRGGMSR